MHRLIAGGTGLVGQHLVAHWLTQNIAVTVLSRSKEKVAHTFGTSVNAINWHEFNDLKQQDLNQFQSITNLCGVNIGAARWTKSRKQAIIDSRIKTTKTITEKILPLGDNAPRLFNASAIGTYGLQKTIPNHLPQALDEDTPIDFDHPKDFLAEVGSHWEQATITAKAHGIHVVNMRFGVVLTPSGGAFEKLVTPFKFYLGGKIGSGSQAFTWVHIKDLVKIIDFLYEHPDIHGPVNFTAPEAVMQKELAKTIAKTLHKACIFPLPSITVKLLFGEMGECLLLKGQNIYPKKLIAHDFEFEYPEINSAVQNLLS